MSDGSASGTGTGGTLGSGGQGGVRSSGGGNGSGGSMGSGGSTAGGGSTASGGAAASGGSTAGGGSTASGGAAASGGSAARGGSAASGGSVASGGSFGSGGSASSGGSVGSGGSTRNGGSAASGGSVAAGGSVGSGGSVGNGGSAASGGSVGTGGSVASGGSVGTGGSVASGGSQGRGGSVGTGGGQGTGGGIGSGGGARTGGTTGGTGGSTGTGGKPAGGATVTGGAGGGGASGTGGAQPFKGIAGGACKVRTAMGVSWYYNWSGSENEACAAPNGVEYVPMIWGADTAANIKTAVAGFASKGSKYVLGFNEPDNVATGGGSNIAVASAIALLPSFDVPAITVGTPATQANTIGQTWFKEYMADVAANTTLRADFIAIHWYGWNAGSCDAAASQLEGYINYAEGFPGNRPIWLTEWSCLNQSAPTAAGVIAFFKGALAVFAKHPRLARYAWYQWSPNCEVYNTDDTLTELGQVYAAAPAKK